MTGRSPASAQCSSACPDHSVAPAAAPSLQLDLLWAYGRPSPDTGVIVPFIYRHTSHQSLLVALDVISPLRSPWFHFVTPVCPASQRPSRSPCRSARNPCEVTHSSDRGTRIMKQTPASMFTDTVQLVHKTGSEVHPCQITLDSFSKSFTSTGCASFFCKDLLHTL